MAKIDYFLTGHHFSGGGQTDGRHLGGGRAPELPLPLPHRRLPASPDLHHDSAHQDGPEFAEGNLYSVEKIHLQSVVI